MPTSSVNLRTTPRRNTICYHSHAFGLASLLPFLTSLSPTSSPHAAARTTRTRTGCLDPCFTAQFTLAPLRSPSERPSTADETSPPSCSPHPHLLTHPTRLRSVPIDDFPRRRRLFFQAAHRPPPSPWIRRSPACQRVDQRAKVGRSGGRRGGVEGSDRCCSGATVGQTPHSDPRAK